MLNLLWFQTVGTKYPDVKIEQLVNILMMREDVSRSDAKAKVIDSLGEDHDLKPARSTILSKLYTVWYYKQRSGMGRMGGGGGGGVCV